MFPAISQHSNSNSKWRTRDAEGGWQASEFSEIIDLSSNMQGKYVNSVDIDPVHICYGPRKRNYSSIVSKYLKIEKSESKNFGQNRAVMDQLESFKS